MQIKYNFKNFEPSDHLRNYASTRFEKLFKYDRTENALLQVNLSVDKFRHKADVVFTGDELHISAVEESEDMYSTVDLVLDKLDAQVRKTREKAKDRRQARGSVRMDVISFADSAAGERVPTIEESDSYEPKPMAVEEAALQLDSLGYEFLVFHNAESERINVIYLRKNGDYGLIDPGM
ncbi:ribosome hibernation-promoting factor, HPF/YfiA family [Desulfovibrio ferrophilus]|uniref:Ribosome hibernation promoting factor n=1 Tax=Desulfovibrio ferrophilus TaxID=241368 RepID=A0A2Z6AWF2_9BACT|nr:ribosome-associated translation inhibitor RaiA [Desulfovibrio ferrophilus]BBD07574.1 sigma 54 modulation protein/ribosomal proteinS30EA domain protein [Desulfovibrio ferrophilus]